MEIMIKNIVTKKKKLNKQKQKHAGRFIISKETVTQPNGKGLLVSNNNMHIKHRAILSTSTTTPFNQDWSERLDEQIDQLIHSCIHYKSTFASSIRLELTPKLISD